MAELNDVEEYIQRYLARDPGGNTLRGGWVELQHTSQTVFKMCGQQSRLHFHAHGDACNERCDIYPPLPEPEPEPVPVAPVVTACTHGVSLDRDCARCIQEAQMGLRKEAKPGWGGPGEREQ